jgi:hypothetical protein
MYKPTPEQIADLKAKHGDLFLITVEDKAAIFKRPTRKALSYAAKAGEKDPLAFNEVIMRDTFIEGDKELMEDDGYFLGAANQIAEIVSVKTSSLEKF